MHAWVQTPYSHSCSHPILPQVLWGLDQSTHSQQRCPTVGLLRSRPAPSCPSHRPQWRLYGRKHFVTNLVQHVIFLVLVTYVAITSKYVMLDPGGELYE